MGEFCLEDITDVVDALSLAWVIVGDHLIVVRSSFDVVISGEPYIAFMLILNLKSKACLTRIWNQTVSKSIVSNKQEFSGICRNLFNSSKPCVGYADAKGQEEDNLLVLSPFTRKLSKACLKLIDKDDFSEENSCAECARLKKSMSLNDISREAEIDEKPISENISNDKDQFFVTIEEEIKLNISEDLSVTEMEDKKGKTGTEGTSGSKNILEPVNERFIVQSVGKMKEKRTIDMVTGCDSINEEKEFGETAPSESDFGDDEEKFDFITIEEEERVRIIEDTGVNDFEATEPMAQTVANKGENVRADEKSQPRSLNQNKINQNLQLKFKCPECDWAGCDSEYALRKHFISAHTLNTATHISKLPQYPCLRCCGFFSKEEYLKRHYCRRKGEGLKKLQIPVTQKDEFESANFEEGALSISDSSTLDKPETVVEDEGVDKAGEYPCEVCGSIFSHEALKEHMGDNHSGQKCEYCPYVGEQLDEHVSSLHTCQTCGKRFRSTPRLFDHTKGHLLEKGCTEAEARKELEAKFLNRGFLNSSLFSKPIFYSCEICGKMFASMPSLSVHQTISHIDVNAKASCSKCFMVFETFMKMKEHKLKDHREEKFPCQHCGVNFRLTNIEKHIATQHNETLLKCNDCDLKFRTKQKLKLHEIKEHSTDERYKCKFCGSHQGSEGRLKRHLKVHDDPRFKCGYCEKVFRLEKKLIVHERNHTGERPFTCDVCGKGLKTSGALYTHRTYVHKIVKPGTNPSFERRIRKRKKVD